MIALIAALVCIGLFSATPTLAIPSPDFVGPVVAWIFTMIGVASTVFGALGIWIKRTAQRLTPQHRRLAWICLGGGFVLTLIIVSSFAYSRLQHSRARFETERLRQDLNTTNEHATSTPLTIIDVPPPPVVIEAPTTSLLSSRVSSSTILIPIETLRQVVAEPSWSDRTSLVDIREAEEREVGGIDATTTWIRYGDLINGQAKTLPHDKDILVICWTSLRGQEIATWLRAHGFPRAYAIQGGLQGDINTPSQPGWIDAGLPWRGHTRWSQVFAPSYSISLDEAKKKFDAKATIIDVTSPKDYADGHLPGALSLPLETTTTAEVNRIISLVPPTADLLIYCNGYVNCFYAKIIAIRLQRLGRTYTEPFDDVNGEWKKKGYPMETSQ